jgi:hypothetical protein
LFGKSKARNSTSSAETQVKVLAGYEQVLRQGIDRLDGDAQRFNRKRLRTPLRGRHAA